MVRKRERGVYSVKMNCCEGGGRKRLRRLNENVVGQVGWTG